MRGITRRIRFAVDLTCPVMGVTRRSGWLIEGAAGWGEWSPLPSWSRADAIRAFRGAVESAVSPAPAAVEAAVAINAMIPRVAPAEAERMAAASPCRTIKVKVGDPGSEDRVSAVRSAIGRSAKLRVDANGSWDGETARSMLARLARYDIELAEDPVPTLRELAVLHRGSPIPLAAEMQIRTLAEVKPSILHEAVDALVIKPQRIGGATNALAAAARVNIPVIVSSALETSVGLGTALSVAAALPRGPFAHGIGTALLLASDVTSTPLIPHGGELRPRRVIPDLLLTGAPAP